VSAAPALAHPGSGIAVDQAGNVYFVDTGAGVWKIDSQRQVARLKGPAYHFMAMDGRDRLVQAKLPRAGGEEVDDELYQEAVRVVCEMGRASTSTLQRRLRVGYGRAARIMDELENRGIVGPSKGAEPRDILIDLDGTGADGQGQ
jgi:DNA segregation ATPase FtsK/SpoIIIE-like protein